MGPDRHLSTSLHTYVNVDREDRPLCARRRGTSAHVFSYTFYFYAYTRVSHARRRGQT